MPRQRWSQAPKIVVLRNNDIGDVLVVTPVFEALRRAFPDCVLFAAVGDWSRAVLDGNPHLSGVVSVNAPWFNKYTAGSPLERVRYLLGNEARQLRELELDIGLDPTGSTWGAALFLRCGIPTRVGVSGYSGGEAGYSASVCFDAKEHVGRRALRMAELLGAREIPPLRPQIFLSDEEQRQAAELWSSAGPAVRVVVAPDGGLAEKCWPLESYAALVKKLVDRGQAELMVLRGRGSSQRFIDVDSPRLHIPGEPLGLRSTFAAIAAADVVICNSSMVLHAAAAFDKPTLVLLGPSFPSAEAHDLAWGYPGVSVTLGGRSGPPSVSDAELAVTRLLKRHPARSRRSGD